MKKAKNNIIAIVHLRKDTSNDRFAGEVNRIHHCISIILTLTRNTIYSRKKFAREVKEKI